MKKTLTALTLILAGPAMAEGELNIYNWGNYTSPDMIEKFEKETGRCGIRSGPQLHRAMAVGDRRGDGEHRGL